MFHLATVFWSCWSKETCFIYSNAVYPSEPDEEDRNEIEVGSSEDDDDGDDDDDDDEQPTTSGMTSSDWSGNTVAVSCSSSEASPRSM